MARGFVYILTTKSFPYVKIGKASDVEGRLKTLNTAVPFPFQIFATLEAYNYDDLEKLMHKELKKVRVSDAEFF